jgi:hypothetical protein
VVRRFNDRQIDLATTFADQAVIAIENVRLFYEIQEKSRQRRIGGRSNKWIAFASLGIRGCCAVHRNDAKGVPFAEIQIPEPCPAPFALNGCNPDFLLSASCWPPYPHTSDATASARQELTG